MVRYKKTSPKGFSALKCDVQNWMFSKLETSLKFFWIFSGIFWIFLGFLLKEFFGGLLEDFWEDFFGRNSLFTLLKSAKLFESERD